ncbi:MAG: hypothetical protein HYZ73_05220 [Elusimicrobia bacterium]|nr:hypothetical protein [Elusimicrobiota bacterium]
MKRLLDAVISERRREDNLPARCRTQYFWGGRGRGRSGFSSLLQQLRKVPKRLRPLYVAADERTIEMIQQKRQAKMFGNDKDTHLFVGNQHRFKTLMVLGIFWLPKIVA